MTTEEILKAGKDYADTPAATFWNGGKKFREGFRNDLQPTIENHILEYQQLGRIFYFSDLHKVAIEYTLEMWREYKKQAGFINDTLKSFYAWEVTMAVKDIYNGEMDVNDFHSKTYRIANLEFLTKDGISDLLKNIK